MVDFISFLALWNYLYPLVDSISSSLQEACDFILFL